MSEKKDEVIFQQFTLNHKKFKEALTTFSYPERKWERVKTILEIWGFGLICSNSRSDGSVPMSVLVSAPRDCVGLNFSISDIFLKETGEAGLPFEEEGFFLEESGVSMSKKKILDKNQRAFLKLQSDLDWCGNNIGNWVIIVNGKLREVVIEGDNATGEYSREVAAKKFPGEDVFVGQILCE